MDRRSIGYNTARPAAGIIFDAAQVRMKSGQCYSCQESVDEIRTIHTRGADMDRVILTCEVGEINIIIIENKRHKSIGLCPDSSTDLRIR